MNNKKNQFSVTLSDGSKAAICYPTKIRVGQVILGKKVNGGALLLNAEIEVTKKGWIARSTAGTIINAERAGNLRDKTQFIS